MGPEAKDKRLERERVLGVDREVPCTVFPGMFTGQIYVLIPLPNGDVVSGNFDEVYASWEGDLERGGVPRTFGVRTIKKDQDGALVEFTSNPGMHLDFYSLTRAWVPNSFLLDIPQVPQN